MMARFGRFTSVVTPLLFLVLPLLTPIAYASPADPSWVHGLYDGGDFDDVVVLVTSGVGVVELTPLADLSPALPLVIGPVHCPDGSVSAESSGSLHSRAPPAQ